jgi:bifunctional DNA-binding transcriptional regulator/antitoxin component of YhaV-PrlF toxin-antitoxin module
MMTVLTISTKDWVVIPTALRRKYQLEPGTRVQIVDYGGVLAIVHHAKTPIGAAAGMLAGNQSLTEALLTEHRAERLREDQLDSL